MGTQQISIHKDVDTFSKRIANVEIASDYSTAIVTIPLMHVGANKKGLFWTKEMLKKIVPLFQGIPFRYDLDGQEGSSHTINKLSSPHFDVGWTYDGEDGAWFQDKTLWVRGEVTHPQVIKKLSRKTTDGKREVNYASMGIIVDEAKCSICGSEFGTCEHQRNEKYLEGIAYKVPTKCSKGLHAALTNDPADAEAEIKECIFQELGGNQMLGQDTRIQSGEQNPNINDQMSGGLAPSSPQTGQPGIAPSPQDMLRDLAERIKTIEQKFSEGNMAEQTPELINSAPQDQMTQDNMGVTSQFDKSEEVQKMDKTDGQSSNDKTEVNPKPELQDGMIGMDQIMQVLQQILAAVSGNGPEMQDMGKEAQDANKGMIQHDETKPQDHLPPGDQVSTEAEADEGNKKNKQHMNEPGKVATADDSKEEVKKEENEVDTLKQEMADMASQMKELRKRTEIQDNEVPEFGGTPATAGKVDVADMGADKIAEEFGDFGKWDACFNGADSASKFKR